MGGWGPRAVSVYKGGATGRRTEPGQRFHILCVQTDCCIVYQQKYDQADLLKLFQGIQAPV